MKIGISDRMKWGDEYFLRLKAFGFECYDFNIADTGNPLYEYEEDDFIKYLNKQKRLAEEAGITIWQVHGPWRYPPRDSTAQDRSERLEKMKRSIRAAAILGAKYWIVHPIMPCGTSDIITKDATITRELNLEFMSKLLLAAKQEGVTVCLENMPFTDFSLSSPADIADIVREINDPSFLMCLDTGHTNKSPKWDTPADAIRKYGKYIKALHVHDNSGRHDEHLMPFCGTIDWQDFSNALAEIDFDGVLSLECAPPSKLPSDILEKTYFIYAAIARAIADNKLS